MTCWSNLAVRKTEINSSLNYVGIHSKNSYARCDNPRCEPCVSCKCCYQTSWCVKDLNSQWEVNEAMDGKQADTVVRNSVSTKPQNVREREGKWRTCLCLTRTKTQRQRLCSLLHGPIQTDPQFSAAQFPRAAGSYFQSIWGWEGAEVIWIFISTCYSGWLYLPVSWEAIAWRLNFREPNSRPLESGLVAIRL